LANFPPEVLSFSTKHPWIC